MRHGAVAALIDRQAGARTNGGPLGAHRSLSTPGQGDHVRMQAQTLTATALMLLAATSIAAAADRTLVDAAKRQDSTGARALIAKNVDVNVAGPDGATALHWAAHWNDVDLAARLLRAGAAANAGNDHGVTPLALAALNGSPEMVRLLLEGKADPNLARSTGETPLMTAARTGVLDVVSQLLTAGAVVTAKEPSQDQDALMWALSEGHTAVAQALIARGANIQARSKGGFTPLLFAARAGDLESTVALVKAGADVNDASPDGTSALLLATVRGHAKLAMHLLEQGANPNVDAAGFTALHWASGSWETELTGPNGIVARSDEEWNALPGVQDGKLALVEALLAHGADPNAAMGKIPPRVGYTQLAVENRVVGVNPHAGATPYVLAALAGEVEIMRALAKAGADPRGTTGDKTTALMVAAGLGRYQAESRLTEARAIETVNAALELGSDINAANEAGNTALHGAAYIKSERMVQLLVDKGATINVQNKRGQTPTVVADTIRAGSATVAGKTSTGDLLRRLAAQSQAAK
jgi:ankyrin repeat protein